MNGVLERTLGILELLCAHGEGLELAAIAERLNIPKSAAHRLLADLTRCGYVRQSREMGDYLLTTKLVSMGLSCWTVWRSFPANWCVCRWWMVTV
jgi:DNA-binding IclR family transcriptional regulator